MASVTRKAQGGRRDRGGEVEGRLLGAVGRLAARGLGFTEVSIAQLAAEAGISRATFYVYFADKGELAVRLAERAASQLQVAAEPAWDFAEGMSRVQLRAAVGRVIGLYRSNAPVYAALTDAARYDPMARQMLGVVMEEIISRTVVLVRRCQHSGRAAPGPSREIAAALVWMMERACHQLPLDADPEAEGRVVDAATVIIWQTLFAGPENGPDGPGNA